MYDAVGDLDYRASPDALPVGVQISHHLSKRLGFDGQVFVAHSVHAQNGPAAGVHGIFDIGDHLLPALALDILGAIIWLVPIIGLVGPGTHDLDETMIIFQFEGGGELPPMPVAEADVEAPYTGKGPPKYKGPGSTKGKPR